MVICLKLLIKTAFTTHKHFLLHLFRDGNTVAFIFFHVVIRTVMVMMIFMITNHYSHCDSWQIFNVDFRLCAL